MILTYLKQRNIKGVDVGVCVCVCVGGGGGV
jgi:hypothetical protein